MRTRLAGGLLALAALAGPAAAAAAAGVLPGRPAARARVVTAAPPGWTATRRGPLQLALPPGFAPVASGSGLAAAAAQWTKTDDRRLVVAPAVVLYAEHGAVGPLGARAALVVRSRSAELGVQPSRPPHSVPVPGAQAAVAAEWTWAQPLGAARTALASRQLEVVVQAPAGEQYGLSLGGPASYLTDQVVADFLASLAVQEAS